MSAVAARPIAPAPRRAATVALWAVQVALAAVFLMAGGAKLAGAPDAVAQFNVVGAVLGTGQWFRYLTGALEVSGAVLLLVPGFAAIGAVELGGVMLGAILTHLFVVHTPPTAPATLLLLLAAVVYARRGQLARFAGQR